VLRILAMRRQEDQAAVDRTDASTLQRARRSLRQCAWSVHWWVLSGERWDAVADGQGKLQARGLPSGASMCGGGGIRCSE
jgi:hypothetical protein